MPKPGRDRVRQKESANALLDVIRNHRMSGTSASQISARTDFSYGMVNRHLANTDELFGAKISELPVRMATELLTPLESAQTRFKRVHAAADGTLSADGPTEQKVAVSLAFCAQAPHAPRLQRVHDSITRRTQTGQFRGSKELVPRDEVACRLTHGLPRRQLGNFVAKLNRPLIK